MVMNTMDLFCTYEQSLILKRKIFLSILKLSNGNGNTQKISTKDYWNLEYTLAHPPRLALGRRPGLLHPMLPRVRLHRPPGQLTLAVQQRPVQVCGALDVVE